MNALIFDTETNGTPLNYKAPMSDVNNWPRIAQLGWQKRDVLEDVILKEHQAMIFPDGWTIPTVEELTSVNAKDPHFFERNGMSTQRCKDEGQPIAEQLQLLIEQMNDCQLLVAHNIEFDVNVVGAEMIRLDMSAERKLVRICTMKSSTYYCKLPGGFRGQPKWPRLEELHRILFKKDFDGAHDALSDVRATGNCLIELIKRNVIKLK